MASWKINALKNNLNFLHGLVYVRVILVQFLKLVFEMLRKWIEEGGKKYRNEAKQFSFEQKVPYIYTNLHQMLRKKEWMQWFFLKETLLYPRLCMKFSSNAKLNFSLEWARQTDCRQRATLFSFTIFNFWMAIWQMQFGIALHCGRMCYI